MAIRFNGVDNRIESATVFVPPAAGSVSLWTNPDDLTGSRRLIGIDNLWEIRSSGTSLLMELWQSGTVPTGTISVTGWHHIVGSYASSSTGLELWIDGVLVDSKASQTAPAITNRVLTIGNRTGATATEGVLGDLDDVRIYDRQLYGSEVETLYALRGRDGIRSGLLHRYTMREGAPGTSVGVAGAVKDLAGALNMSAIGTPIYSVSALNLLRRAA